MSVAYQYIETREPKEEIHRLHERNLKFVALVPVKFEIMTVGTSQHSFATDYVIIAEFIKP